MNEKYKKYLIIGAIVLVGFSVLSGGKDETKIDKPIVKKEIVKVVKKVDKPVVKQTSEDILENDILPESPEPAQVVKEDEIILPILEVAKPTKTISDSNLTFEEKLRLQNYSSPLEKLQKMDMSININRKISFKKNIKKGKKVEQSRGGFEIIEDDSGGTNLDDLLN